MANPSSVLRLGPVPLESLNCRNASRSFFVSLAFTLDDDGSLDNLPFCAGAESEEEEGSTMVSGTGRFEGFFSSASAERAVDEEATG